MNGRTYASCYKLRLTCWFGAKALSQWSPIYLWVKPDLGLVRSIWEDAFIQPPSSS